MRKSTLKKIEDALREECEYLEGFNADNTETKLALEKQRNELRLAAFLIQEQRLLPSVSRAKGFAFKEISIPFDKIE